MTSEAMPVSSDAKKPTEKTEPNAARMISAPTHTIRPSISVAPTRGHQPAS
jgi:hypothetical protein